MMSDKARVLVVDDEMDIRDGCERVLTRAGYEVVKSDTGEKAVGLFKPGAFDIVLLDLKMPGMDGMDVLERIKEIDEDVLVVIITGYATVETAVEALKMGAYDLLPKPFQIDHLRIVVGRAWDRLSLTRETAKLAEQRRKSMLDLDAEKSRLRTIVESLADGVVVTNTEGRVVLMNKPFVESVCREPDSGPGNMIEEYVYNSDLIEVVREASDCKTQENASMSREIEVRDNRHFLAEGRHIIDSDGECLGGVVTLFDITGMKMLDKLKTEFVSRITHELRSPLSTIYNQLGSVLGDISGNTMVRDRNLLSRAMERTNGLISLIGDLLDLSRIEEGSFLRQRQSVKLELFLADVVGFLQTRAEEKHQKLCLSLPTGSSFEIHADPMALESVVGNLITNAIKYSSDGTSIDVALRRQSDDIVITVADNGYGIGGDDIERIFERFYRVRNEHTRDIIGTGLGLPIVKALVEEMGGEISVKSTLNEGSTFTVLLPKAALQNDPGQDKN